MEVEEKSEILKLYDYLLKFRTALNHPRLQIDNVNSKLFKSKTKQNFQNLMSRIYLYSLDYIAIDNLKGDTSELKLHTIRALKARQLHDVALRQNEILENHMQKKPIDIWDNLILAQALHAINFSVHPKSNHYIISLVDRWLHSRQDLDSFYNTGLVFARSIASVDSVVNESMIHKISLDKTTEIQQTAISTIMINAIAARESNDQKSLDFLQEYLHNKVDTLSNDLSYLILMLCIEGQIKLIKAGKTKLNDLYALEKIGYESGLLISQGKVDQIRFIISAELICYVKGVEYAIEWIEKWGELLQNKIQNQVKNLAISKAYIIDGNADKAIDLINNTNFSSENLNRLGRLNLLIAYFLKYTNTYEFVESQIVNFQKYIRRHKENMSSNVYEGYINFIIVMKNLIKKEDTIETEQLLLKLNNITSRSWLNHYINQKKSRT